MERAPKNCIICNTSDRSFLIKKGDWIVYKCNSCGLGILDPRPDEKEFSDLYDKNYFESHYDNGLKIGSDEMQRRISQQGHRIRFFRRYKKRGRILDIGCGQGYFLLACQRLGYVVEGMDISDESASYVRNELKIPVATGSIKDTKFQSNSYDVITMWHFLEHVPNPKIYIDKARQWLKNDGFLVVDVPNYEGFDAQADLRNWPNWDLPYHLYHFTARNLTVILEQHGFKIIRTKDYLSEHVKERLERIPISKLLARTIARFFSGHSFAVVAKKE
jgi:2-polyprenyl-3-methyl-5-hydroxy-6-metoxy-1,4-benzoquinol methylase